MKLIHSKTLGLTIALAHDGEQIPPGYVRYKPSELRLIAGANLTAEELRLVHAAKVRFSGTIVREPA